jgi:predicted membrane protein
MAAMTIVGAIRTIVTFLVLIAALAIAVWATVDAVRRPREAFSLAGSSKLLWVTLLVMFDVLAFFVSAVLGAVYLVRIRPRVAAKRTSNEINQQPEGQV